MIKGKVIVVDDNAGIRTALKFLLGLNFSDVELLASPVELLSSVSRFNPDVVLLDMNFKSDINTGNEGLFWLSELKHNFPELKVVLFTAYADISLAIEGMKRGAYDFVIKPWDNEKLIEILSNACDSHKTKNVRVPAKITMYWGASREMDEICKTVNKIAQTDVSVLITGENGTGKDMLANEIHRLSLRSSRPMVAVDAGAIPETLFESELFGHVKGAFTDAFADRDGKILAADNSTLFLDEIGNISLPMQAKLLRVLQNRTISRVGDTKIIPVDVRLICATNMDIKQMVIEGKFREDLYYRINTIHLQIPPLRKRVEDIIPLAKSFLSHYSDKYHREISSISDEGENALMSYSWPGNIRELQNCIEKAVILSEGSVLQLAELQLPECLDSTISKLNNDDLGNIETLNEAEERAIRAAMEKYSGNLSQVAKSLNISRPTLYSKLKKYGI